MTMHPEDTMYRARIKGSHKYVYGKLGQAKDRYYIFNPIPLPGYSFVKVEPDTIMMCKEAKND